MLRTLKFPLLYVLQVLLLFPLFAGTAIAVGFLAAEPIASLNLQGKSLPPDWVAAYPNHDRYLQGYLIGDHPILFIGVIIVVAFNAMSMHYIYKAQDIQRAASSSPKAHTIAAGVVLGAFAVAAYIL